MKNRSDAVLLRLLFIVTFTLISVSCASELKVTDPRTGVEYVIPSRFNNVPGIEKLAQLCAEKGGREVKQVVSVDGYFDQNKKQCDMDCWDRVSGSRLNYLEIKVEEPESFHFIKEPGIWEIYKTAIDDPNCHPKIKRFMQRRKFYKDFIGTQCLALKKNEQIESQYELSFDYIRTYLPNEYRSRITETRMRVKDLFSGKEVATQSHYSLMPKHSRLDPGWSFGCGSIGIKHYKTTLESVVFKAKGEQ